MNPAGLRARFEDHIADHCHTLRYVEHETRLLGRLCNAQLVIDSTGVGPPVPPHRRWNNSRRWASSSYTYFLIQQSHPFIKPLQ
jgi:hypothetical protein